jgi:hypothetical protein
MKAEDLRKGNWVNVTKSPFETEIGQYQISSQGIMYLDDKDNVNDYIVEPIPLNEEWLFNKFGFEYETNEGDAYLVNGMIWIYDCKRVYLVDENLHFLFIKEINFVHEIQNFYKEITGKELTLN